MTRSLLAISVALIASTGAMNAASAEPQPEPRPNPAREIRPVKKVIDTAPAAAEAEGIRQDLQRPPERGPVAAGAQARTPRVGIRERGQISEESRQRQLPCLTMARSGNWSLEGTLITPDQVIPQGVITIAGQKIAAVNAIKAGGPPSCSIKIDGIILPGLIDLHNHLTWNVLPRWQPPKQYSNREEWRLSSENQETLVKPQDNLLWTSPGLGCEANLYAEVKALVGGATSAVGSHNIHKYGSEGRCLTGLIRNLDYESQFSQFAGEISNPLHATPNWRALIDSCARQTPDGDPIVDVAVNEIFPLGRENAPPASPTPKLSPSRVDYLKCHLTTGRLRSLLVHLAEGNPTDLPSRQEFAQLQALGLVREGLIIIHGTALQHEDFVAMKSSGVGLVWSPRSNMELYGVTVDIPAARNAGVSIAIAPDWSPTGSDGMLQELNYARARFNDFNAEQLTTMATSIPARLARVDDRIGHLKTGLYADLFVVRRKEGSAYDSVVTASPADVQLVVIGGRPVYGDSALMQQLAPDKTLTLMTICGASKAVDLGETLAAESSWDAVKSSLQARLGSHSKAPGPYECPKGSPSDFPRKRGAGAK